MTGGLGSFSPDWSHNGHSPGEEERTLGKTSRGGALCPVSRLLLPLEPGCQATQPFHRQTLQRASSPGGQSYLLPSMRAHSQAWPHVLGS